MKLPERVVIGTGAIESLGSELKDVGIKQVSIFTSKTPYSKYRGIIEKTLRSENITFQWYIVRGEVEEAIEKLEKANIRGDILAFGGGKVIDVGKYVAWKKKRSFVSIPTTASHDGIASPLVSIPTENRRYSLFATVPKLILADIEIIKTAPYRLSASGCGDVLAKHTAVRDWRLAHLLRGEYYGEYAASLAEVCVERVVNHAELIAGRGAPGIRILVEALIHCGVIISIAGSSRPCSGSEHLFSHALDLIANRPALHGEQVGVGTIMMAYLHGTDWKMIRDTLREVGSPTTAEELGVKPRAIIKALTIAHKIRPERYTILGDRGISYEAAEKLAKETGVIP